MTVVETLYSCVLCHKSFVKRQSLAAHMRVHRDVEFAQFKIRVPKDVKDGFMAVCRKHHATACHVLYVLMKATVKGDELGILDLSMKNPFIVQMQHYFASRPRGHGKYEAAGLAGSEPATPAVLCVFSDGYHEGKVFCQLYGAGWVEAGKCVSCPKNRLRLNSP